jgi:hypothetical protein
MAEGRRPDYRLSVIDKTNSKRKGYVGVAWLNEGGSIGITFNPGVVLGLDPNLAITLFPILEEGTGPRKLPIKPGEQDEGDIPFG